MGITRPTAPSYLKWMFSISPLGVCLQDIFVRMRNDMPSIDNDELKQKVLACGGDEACVKDALKPLMELEIVDGMGFEGGKEGAGIAMMVSMCFVFRILQVLSLKYLNNIHR